MATTCPPTTSATRCTSVHLHTAPLDSIILALEALEASPCRWCQDMLRMIKRHIEELHVPARGLEVRN